MENENQQLHRKIIHIDMDAFYASVEQRDFPEYRGKAIVVGGSPSGRGVVATASYEARKFGVKSAMSSIKAQQLCPHVIFVRPRFAAYKEVSRQIRAIFGRYTDLIEPLSLDEAYLDVTNDKMGIGSAITIAEQIKQAIKDELNLTASAGVSINKFVAKTASDMNKPDGLTFIGIKDRKIYGAVASREIFGVGKVTAEKMKQQGLHKGADLKKLTEQHLTQLFGKSGKFFYNIVRGIDKREVQPNHETKSVSAEDTFSHDLEKGEELNEWLETIAKSAFKRIEQYQMFGRTLTLKVKFDDFKQITRSTSFPLPITDFDQVLDTCKSLLASVDLGERKIRLLGVGFANFGENRTRDRLDGYQYRLFSDD